MERNYLIFLALVIVAVMAMPAIATYTSDHTQNECRMEALKAGKSTEDILKICK